LEKRAENPKNSGANLYRELLKNSSLYVSDAVFANAMTKTINSAMKSAWVVYILQTAGGLLYTGITTDLPRRLAEHAGSGVGSGKGAKSLRGKGPLTQVYQLSARDRSEASRWEARIKKLPRADKERLIGGDRSLLERIKG
jgi:putative endonuclease